MIVGRDKRIATLAGVCYVVAAVVTEGWLSGLKRRFAKPLYGIKAYTEGSNPSPSANLGMTFWKGSAQPRTLRGLRVLTCYTPYRKHFGVGDMDAVEQLFPGGVQVGDNHLLAVGLRAADAGQRGVMSFVMLAVCVMLLLVAVMVTE